MTEPDSAERRERRKIQNPTSGRKYTAIACVRCWKSKTRCSISRPCCRCIRLDCVDDCVDRPTESRKRQNKNKNKNQNKNNKKYKRIRNNNYKINKKSTKKTKIKIKKEKIRKNKIKIKIKTSKMKLSNIQQTNNKNNKKHKLISSNSSSSSPQNNNSDSSSIAHINNINFYIFNDIFNSCNNHSIEYDTDYDEQIEINQLIDTETNYTRTPMIPIRNKHVPSLPLLPPPLLLPFNAFNQYNSINSITTVFNISNYKKNVD